MKEKKIVECIISEGRFRNTISIKCDDGSVIKRLYSYYPDELHFSESEFIGLTVEQACDLIKGKDVAYLRS